DPYIAQLKGQVDLNNAQEARSKNDLKGMLKWYKEAAHDDPALTPKLQGVISQLQGQLNFQDNQWPHIANALKEAQDLNYGTPLDAGKNYRQGTTGTGGTKPDPQAAIAILEQVKEQYPGLAKYGYGSVINAPLAQYMAAMAKYPPHQTQSHPEEAVAILQESVERDPGILKQDPSIYLRMAQYAWADGRIGQARQLFAEFQPYQAAYEKAFGDKTGPAEFAQQLSGNANAVMSNFQTYAADWISSHTPIMSSQWWQNNVLSALSGWMPPNWFQDSQSQFEPWHPFGGAQHTQMELDSSAPSRLDDQLKEHRETLAETHDPIKRRELEERIEKLDAERQTLEQGNYKAGEEVDAPGGGRRGRLGKKYWDYKISKDTGEPAADSRAVQGLAAEHNLMAPGYWGLGLTIAQASNHYKKYGELSSANPYVIEKRGTGLASQSLTASGGVNVLNAQARTFRMIYGGGTQAGHGFEAMYGRQARADLLDEQYGLQYGAGSATIGGQKFDSQTGTQFVSGGMSEMSAVGAQADAQGGLSTGSKEAFHAGGHAGGFAGAQLSVQTSANMLGQGAFAVTQAWLGVGAKATGSFALNSSGLHFDLGAGGALGAGGYVQVGGNINFLAIGQDFSAIYGDKDHTFGGMLKRTGDLVSDAGISAINAAPHLAVDYAVTKGLIKAGKKLGKKAAEQVGQKAVQAETKGTVQFGEKAPDAAEAPEAPDAAAAGDAVDAAVGEELVDSAAAGPVGLAIGSLAAGVTLIATHAKQVWGAVKSAAKTTWDWIKGIF
ncbi:MAG: hypothetical protein JKY15_00665, partial [Deltaproteobacteria bacterium]|nr:hypothetical protein [Deltaproteobacteria bacterium]